MADDGSVSSGVRTARGEGESSEGERVREGRGVSGAAASRRGRARGEVAERRARGHVHGRACRLEVTVNGGADKCGPWGSDLGARGERVTMLTGQARNTHTHTEREQGAR
jgi:hypothetical protein